MIAQYLVKSFKSLLWPLSDNFRYAIHFCKSIDTDEYARVALSAAERVSSEESDSEADPTPAAPPALYSLTRAPTWL